MFEATHLNTLNSGESKIRSTYYAYQIWSVFEDPYKEDWVCCPVCKKKVTPVKPHYRKDGASFVNTHFRNVSGESCITGESDEHKNAKILIANLVENQKIRLKIKNSFINFHDLKFKEVPRMPFRWEQKRENRRADVLFEFVDWHNVLGQGINFEIQDYKIEETEKTKRETDWIQNGYSLTWIPLDSFKDESLSSNDLEISFVWSIEYLKSMRILKDDLSKLFYEIKHEMQKYESRRNKTCRTCIYGSQDKNNPEITVCWHGTKYGKTQDDSWGFRKYPTKHEPLDICNNYKNKVEK